MIPRAAAAAAHVVGLKPIPVPPDHERKASVSRKDLGVAERLSVKPHQIPKLRIAAAVDTAISMSADRPSFIERLKDLGVEVEIIKKSGGEEQGIKYRLAGERNWQKGSGIGKAYSLKSIDRRLAGDVDYLVAAQRFADRKRKSGVLQKLTREQQAGKEVVRWSNGYVAAVATESEIRWRTGSAAEAAVCAALAKEKGWAEMVLSDRGTDEKNLAAVEAYHRAGISVQLKGQRYPAPVAAVTKQELSNGNDGRDPRAGQGGGGIAAPDHGVVEVDGISSQRPPQKDQRPGATARPTASATAGAGGTTGKALADDERNRIAGEETATASTKEEEMDLLDFLNDPAGSRERAQRALEDLSDVNLGDHSARIIAEAHQMEPEAVDPLDFLSEQGQPEQTTEPEPNPNPITAQEQAPVTHQPQPSPDPIPTDEDLRRAEDEVVARLAKYEGDMESIRPRTSAQIKIDLVAARQQREWHEMQSLIHRMKPSTIKEIAALRERESDLGTALKLARKREAEARRQIRRDPAAMAAIQTRATGFACDRAERKKADELRRQVEKAKRELAQRQKEEEAKRQREREEVKPTKKRKGKTEWKPN
ncbi:MAG: hypothetical protein AMXMBFR31_09890 [Candidatus Desulfobacillus denitrificans]|nr:hypothetical protein [Candidatus Hydrogenedentota bacterium]MCZ2174564.1 hypothetical protein [Burkholderiales bacterium]